MGLLDSEARTRVEAAIGEFERRTAGEIVVVEVPASGRYPAARLLYAGAAALGAAALVHWGWPRLAFVWLLWLELGVAACAFFALGWRPLLRIAVPHAELREAVERRAHEEFLRHGVFATRERTGILILVSELERQVVILGDRGIDAHVQASGWQAYVAQVIAAIRAGRPAQGLCEVIAAVGDVLANQLPVQPDDRDELENRVRQEDR